MLPPLLLHLLVLLLDEPVALDIVGASVAPRLSLLLAYPHLLACPRETGRGEAAPAPVLIPT